MSASMDPFSVLGVPRDAPPDALAAAYRREAKRWHPDRAADQADAARRMAEINAAYDLLRDGGWRTAMAERAAAAPGAAPAPRRRARGSWLPADVRRALGGELIAALQDGEDVRVVTPCATWASPTTVLAVTDRRLLLMLDDAIGQRVQSIPFRDIAEVQTGRRRLRRDVAVVRIRTVRGRRVTFAELRPAMAADVARRIGEGLRRRAA
jgi:curved DNA-binding protein CbpA